MAQIYERKDIYDDLAKNIGTGLQNLANYKLQQMHKNKEEEENYNFLKTIYPEHVAKALAPQSEKTRNEFLKNFQANPDYQQPSEKAQVTGAFKPDIPEDQLKGFVDYLNSPDSPDDLAGLQQQGQQKPPMPGLENLIPQLKQQQPKPEQIPTQAPKTMGAGPMMPPQQQAAPMGQPGVGNQNVPAVIKRAGAATGGITPYQQEKLDREEQEKVLPFVEKELVRAENAQEVKDIAEEMLQIAKKNKDKWPTVGGYLPEKFQRDPDIRRYATLANQLVVAKSNALRGVPTNFRTKLVQQGKIDLSQPYNTQLQGLNQEIKNSDKLLEIPRTIEKFKEENNGKYPRDLASRVYGKQHLSNREEKIPTDLPNASLYVGKKGIRDKETGIAYYTTDGVNWKIKKDGEENE